MSFGTIGQPVDRVDGRAKVTGTATYAAEHNIDNLAHGVLVQSVISKGRIASLNTNAAQAAPGVLAVFTYQNMPRLNMPDPNGAGGSKPGELFVPLQTDAIHYNGQHIALVIADTLEHAQHAADLVEVMYAAQKPVVEIEQGMNRAYKPAKFFGFEDLQTRRANPTEGLAQSAVQIEQTYSTPVEHHNPMEPHATIAVWDGDHLTLYDSAQGVVASRIICAQALGISPESGENRFAVCGRRVRQQGADVVASHSGGRRGAQSGPPGENRRHAAADVHVEWLPGANGTTNFIGRGRQRQSDGHPASHGHAHLGSGRVLRAAGSNHENAVRLPQSGSVAHPCAFEPEYAYAHARAR